MVLKNRKRGILKNKSGESFIRPIVTELGEKKIIDIFKSSTILEDTLKVIDNTAMKNNYYKYFNKWFDIVLWFNKFYAVKYENYRNISV